MSPGSALALALLTGLAAACQVAAAAGATTCVRESGRERLPLLELYTSEGCSSCPPADRWLSATFAREAPPPVVALAFHVDYWNGLGWPDRFSHHDHGLRQQEIARRNGLATVYTPQFVLDGRDAGPAIRARVDGAASDGATRPAPRTIRVEIRHEADGSLSVSGTAVPPREDRTRGHTYVALVQDALQSRIAAGENRGRVLRHDRVVRRIAGPFADDAEGRAGFEVRWPLPAEFRPRDAGVVVFTEDAATGRTLQALAGPLCP